MRRETAFGDHIALYIEHMVKNSDAEIAHTHFVKVGKAHTHPDHRRLTTSGVLYSPPVYLAGFST